MKQTGQLAARTGLSAACAHREVPTWDSRTASDGQHQKEAEAAEAPTHSATLSPARAVVSLSTVC